MNWDAIGAIAELLGAIGVMGTLLYLAVEMRKNTTATQQQNHHTIVTRRSELFESWSHDKEISALIVTGWAGEDLDPIDAMRFVWAMMNWMGHLQDVFKQYRAGTIERDVWEAEKQSLGATFGQPGFVSWWSEASQYYMPEFVEAIESVEAVDLVAFNRETRKWERPGGVYKL